MEMEAKMALKVRLEERQIGKKTIQELRKDYAHHLVLSDQADAKHLAQIQERKKGRTPASLE